MQALVPLRVIIGLNEKGWHDYPNFDSLDKSVRGNQKWSHFVDRFGGWHYDKQCGHADHDPENGTPAGQWCGMLLVPRDFADAAVEAFPERCSVMNEEDAEAFYDERAHAHEPDIHDDLHVLQAMSARHSVGITEDSDANALDVDHPARGRRRNKTKTWQGFKKQRGIVLDDERLRDVPRRQRKSS